VGSFSSGVDLEIGRRVAPRLGEVVPDKPIIPYARLLSDETLTTQRTYTDYLRRHANRN
jgi:hypothetical protein